MMIVSHSQNKEWKGDTIYQAYNQCHETVFQTLNFEIVRKLIIKRKNDQKWYPLVFGVCKFQNSYTIINILKKKYSSKFFNKALSLQFKSKGRIKRRSDGKRVKKSVCHVGVKSKRMMTCKTEVKKCGLKCNSTNPCRVVIM